MDSVENLSHLIQSKITLRTPILKQNNLVGKRAQNTNGILRLCSLRNNILIRLCLWRRRLSQEKQWIIWQISSKSRSQLKLNRINLRRSPISTFKTSETWQVRSIKSEFLNIPNLRALIKAIIKIKSIIGSMTKKVRPIQMITTVFSQDEWDTENK